MPTLVTHGDRIITLGGRESWLKRPSQPFSSWYGGGHVILAGDARTISFAELYRKQPWVKVCVDKLAHQVATLPLKTYELSSQNERRRVIDHPVPNLLREPWPRARPVHLKQKIAFPALLHGNGLLAKVRPSRGAPPQRLRPLDWRYISPEVDTGDLLFWKTTQYGKDAFIAPEETLHFYWESPDGVTGTSPLCPLGITLRAEDAAQRYSASNFNNAVTPNFGIGLDKDAPYNDDVRNAIRDEVRLLHAGVDQSGGVIVMGGGASFETLSHNAREAELIDVRKLNREEVAAVYDIPPPMIGQLDKATYSNINEQHRMLYMTVLRPWLTLIEETIEAHLIAGERAFEGVFVEFDLNEVLKGDAKERAEAFKAFLEAGVYTINELRALENLPRIDHPLADRPLIPANNMQPLENVGEQPPGDGTAQTLASHLARARDRVLARNGAGAGDLLDADRFERELAEDLASKLNGGAEPFAAVWRAAVEQGVRDADGKDSLRQFFEALGA